MKPLYLEMQGFGPYGDKVVLDFTKLSDGLYLVTGETGSGKTFIFDAICYALYGEVSGSERKTDMLRTLGLDPAKDTYVRLQFSSKGKEYEIKRSPSYERPKKKGTGLTTVAASVELLYEGNSVSKDEQVREKIYELIGLDSKQFKQIVMIAQGKFAQILQDKTDNRQKLLRDIFGTGMYSDLEKKVKIDYDRLRMEYDNCKKGIQERIGEVVISCEAEKNTLDVLKNAECMDVDDVLTLLDSIKNNDSQKKQQAEIKVNNLNVIQQSLSVQIQELKKRKQDEEQLRSFQVQEAMLASELKHLDEDWKHLNQRRQDIEQKRQECQKLQTEEKLQKEKEKRLTDAQNDIKKVKGDFDKALAGEKENDEQRRNFDEERRNLDKAQKQCSEGISFFSVYAENKNASDKKKLDLDIIYKLHNEWDKAKVLLKEKQDKYLQLEKVANELRQRFNNLQQAFYRAQAGIFAGDLQEGMPCPVCGSIEHPHPAVCDDPSLTREEVELSRISADTAVEQAKIASGAAEEAGNTAKKCLSDLVDVAEKYYKEVIPESRMEEIIGRVTADRDQVRKDEERLLIQRKSKEKELGLGEGETIFDLQKRIEQDKKKLEERLDSYHKQEQESQNQLKIAEGAIATKLDQLQSEIMEECSDLAASSAGDIHDDAQELLRSVDLTIQQAGACLKSVGNKVKELRQHYGQLDEEITNFQVKDKQLSESMAKKKENKAMLVGQISVLQEKLQNAGPILDINNLLQKQRENEEQQKKIQSELDGINERQVKNSQAEAAIREKQTNLKEIEIQRQDVDNLYKTLSGNLTNSVAAKMSFETYMQQAYFDRILLYANKRLSQISRGRYMLIRKAETESKGNAKVGLDLNVHDAYSGKERSANSLSGGETFMASLSLALGMADEVQASAGGISINAMFIDEGFGSLSEDFLDGTVDILLKLADNNYQIGVISHIVELKERINQQVIVSKTDKGYSAISLEV